MGNVKKSLSSFFGQVSEALIPSLEDDESDAVLITNDGQVTLVGFQKHLAELQAADETFLTPPAASLSENYQRWLEVTEQDQFTQTRLAKHLASSEILNEKYLTFVPDQIAHMEFWQRYLFRRALLEDALANAELAERRAKSEASSMKTTSPVKAGKAIIQTEQPKRTLSGEEEEEYEDEADLAAIETAVAATDDREAAELESAFGSAGQVLRKQEDQAKWETDDFASVEISEEEQLRLLQEYEDEIQEREKKKSLYVPLEEKLRLEKLTEEQTKLKSTENNRAKKSAPKPNTQNTPTSSNAVKKNIVPNKVSTDHTRSTKAKTTSVPTATNTKKTNPTKSTEAAASTNKTKTPKPTTTSDGVATKNEYLDESSNSDESWEKDFDISDTK